MTPTPQGTSLISAHSEQSLKVRRLIALCAEIQELLQLVQEKKRLLRLLMDQVLETRDRDSGD